MEKIRVPEQLMIKGNGQHGVVNGQKQGEEGKKPEWYHVYPWQREQNEVSEMELCLIHNYWVPGGFRGLRATKQKNLKSMAISDWCCRLMLLKHLYVRAQLCTRVCLLIAGNNRLVAQVPVATLANLKFVFSLLQDSCFWQVVAQLGTIYPRIFCVYLWPCETSSHQWNVNRDNIQHYVVKVVKKQVAEPKVRRAVLAKSPHGQKLLTDHS